MKGEGEGTIILLRAFQIPGWVKEIRPTMMTLNKGLRYQRVNLETGLVCCSPPSSSTAPSCDCFAASVDTLLLDISTRLFNHGVGG